MVQIGGSKASVRSVDDVADVIGLYPLHVGEDACSPEQNEQDEQVISPSTYTAFFFFLIRKNLVSPR
jgi:hypothetical protein